MKKPILPLALAAALLGAGAPAEIATMEVEYHHSDTVLEGFFARDTTRDGDLPAVLVVHQWTGISSHEREIAVRLAEAGYAAFCADIYGQGVRGLSTEEASAQASKYRGDRALFRERLNAGLEQMKAMDGVDATRTAAVGYCFGGGGVLELARSGADTRAVVSFHGNLDTPDASDAEAIRAVVLVHHGAADPLVPEEQVMAFWKEMSDAGVDWRLVAYGGAVHSFTDKKAAMPGVAMYDEHADRRSWNSTMELLREAFGQ